MYYLITEYELPVLMNGRTRKLITIGNKSGFTDMYDYHPLAVENEAHIMSEESLNDFMKDGFSTRSDAENANELKNEIKNFVGMFFEGDFKVMSEDELLQKYKTLI